MSQVKLYQAIARSLDAFQRCQKTGNAEWEANHKKRIEELVDELPHGSGIDAERTLDFGTSTPEKLVIRFSYHHTDGEGYYCGWSDYAVTVRPSLAFGYRLTIAGKDRNQIKGYLHDIFSMALSEEIEEYPESKSA